MMDGARLRHTTWALVLGLMRLVACGGQERDASLPLPTQLRNFKPKACPDIDCKHLGAPARYTKRYAVFMSGRLRVSHSMLTSAMKQIEERYSGDVRVDWYFHVWYNETSPCERKALAELKTIATAITTEPVACMWSWGNGWQNQWHGVDVAYQTLLRFGSPENYTLILKSRVDITYEALDFEGVWARYSAAPATQSANGHFMVFGRSQGWDANMMATPPLAKAVAQYNTKNDPHPTFGCDSTIDSFPFQRMYRYGCWPPTNDPAQKVDFKKFYAGGVKKESRGREPRCAPLFVDHFPSSIKRSFPFHLNPNTDPRLGCTGRRRLRSEEHARDTNASASDRRRLAARVPGDWKMPDDAYCEAHRHDVYYVSTDAPKHSPSEHSHIVQPATRCPPSCDRDGPESYEGQVSAAIEELHLQT